MDTPSRYEEGLTGFRALAAMWVTFFHLFGMVGPKVIAIHPFGIEIELHPLITVGWVGANLFFVLSGFLLMDRLMDRLAQDGEARAVEKYMLARVRRVFPAYWAQIAILLAVSLVVQRAWPDWVRWLPLHLFMLHNVTRESSWAINPVYWTLPIEFFFYLALPWIARILVRAERAGGERRWRTLACVVAGAIAVAWTYRVGTYRIFAPDGEWLVWSMNQTPGTIDQFVIGGAAGVALRWTRATWQPWPDVRRARLSTALFVVGFAGIIGMMYWLDDIFDIFWLGHVALFTWYTITCTFIALVLVAIVLGSRLTRLAFSNPVMVFLGTISYSLYLWHFPIGLWVMGAVDMNGIGLGRFALYVLPPLVAASALSYWAIERPFLAKASGDRLRRRA